MLLIVPHQPLDFIGQRPQRHHGFVGPELVDQAQWKRRPARCSFIGMPPTLPGFMAALTSQM
jgi:hypothetical protein